MNYVIAVGVLFVVVVMRAKVKKKITEHLQKLKKPGGRKDAIRIYDTIMVWKRPFLISARSLGYSSERRIKDEAGASLLDYISTRRMLWSDPSSLRVPNMTPEEVKRIDSQHSIEMAELDQLREDYESFMETSVPLSTKSAH